MFGSFCITSSTGGLSHATFRNRAYRAGLAVVCGGRTGFRLRASLRETMLQLVLQHLLHVVLHLVRVKLRIVWHMRLRSNCGSCGCNACMGGTTASCCQQATAPAATGTPITAASRAANPAARPAAGSAANHGTNPAASRKIATASPP